MERIFIIGAGPAGISASLYVIRGGFAATVIHHGESALAKAKQIQNYFGFKDTLSGAELLQNGIDGAKKLGVEFIDDEVVRLEYEDHLTIKSANTSYESKAVILAAGNRRKSPNILGLKNFHAVSYCAVCDAFFYRKKNVAVIGFGNYAVSEIETLLPVANQVYLFTNGNSVPENLPFNVTVYSDKIQSVEENSIRVSDKNVEIDGIFVAYGTAGSVELAREIGAVVKDGNIVVDENMMTNVPGLFAAGDCTGGLLQVAKAVNDGAVAGLSAIKFVRK